MSRAPSIAMLPDGRRLHLQDGPIDLVIEAFGPASAVQAAYAVAAGAFHGVLDRLCSELPLLRSAATPGSKRPHGSVARRMVAAVAPYGAETFVTPMAAVAGAVADHMLDAMRAAAPLSRAYVNNGGDIALHLDDAQEFRIGMVNRPDRPSLFGHVVVDASSSVRGLATSGWRGRSFSLGIADAVTVLASTAAEADAAATIIANAVDLPEHPGIERLPASMLQPDSDLGQRCVTRAVAPLGPAEVDRALAAGATQADRLIRRGLIQAAALHLQGETRIVGTLPRLAPTSSRSLPEREAAYA